MAQLFTADRFTPTDGNGHVYAGAQLFFYQTGTTTLQTVYADSGATTPLSNPVVADANGLFPAIYLSNVLAYKTVLQTSGGATIRTTDPVSSGSGASTAFVPQGRLTLASGKPVMTATQASATSIIYTPYLGNQIPIYDGISAFSATTFTELTNATTQSSTGNAGPAAVTTNKNYDLFVWSNAGVPTLTRGGAWNSDTARSATTENDLVRINGVLVNLNTITNGPAANRGTYVGTVRSDGSSQINWVVGANAANGTAALLGVWNMYNRVDCRGAIGDTTDNWSYSSATIRAANGSATMRVSWVMGQQEDYFTATYYSTGVCTGGGTARAGVGLDTTTTFTRATAMGTSTVVESAAATGINQQLLGFHFISANEVGDGTNVTQFLGDNGAAFQFSDLQYQGKF